MPPAEPQPFSLLLSTYGGDTPEFLRLAFTSTVQEQTRRPDEVVLVQDGPVPPELAETIADLAATSPVPVKHVVMEDNVGLGPALDRGLEACAHEIVARMDSDDVSRPDRFERQLPLVEAGADIVGSGLYEFGSGVDDVVGRRTPPTDPGTIRRVIRFRDPFNHPTVVYRRSAVLAAGGYTDMALMEDYLLFTRMVEAGARPANVAEPLVYYRVRAAPTPAAAAGAAPFGARPAAAVPRAGHHQPRGVPAQRRRPGLPAGAGVCEKGRLPPPAGQQRCADGWLDCRGNPT